MGHDTAALEQREKELVWEFFRKMYLATPIRQWRLARRRRQPQA